MLTHLHTAPQNSCTHNYTPTQLHTSTHSQHSGRHSWLSKAKDSSYNRGVSQSHNYSYLHQSLHSHSSLGRGKCHFLCGSIWADHGKASLTNLIVLESCASYLADCLLILFQLAIEQLCVVSGRGCLSCSHHTVQPHPAFHLFLPGPIWKV